MSEINVTPIVDVMLVLLIVFMITAPMMVTGVEVDLPESKAQSLGDQQEPLTISLKRSGQVYVMDTLVDKERLVDKLRAITKERMDTKIFIRADKDMSYGGVMSIMGQLNAAGFSRVALVTSVKIDEKR